MGYRVEYEPVKRVRGLEKRVSRCAALTGLFLLLFVLLTCGFWPEGANALRRIVLPGDPAVTAAALEDLKTDLQEGAALGDSLRGFCLRILEGADLGSP